MRKPINLVIAIFLITSTISYGQVVASIEANNDFSMYNTVSTSEKLSYSIVDADTNVQFSKVNYSMKDQKLTLDTKQDVQFISLMKDGEYHITNMPVYSDKLRVSMLNYESGTYELHLLIKGKIVPTIIEIEKK